MGPVLQNTVCLVAGACLCFKDHLHNTFLFTWLCATQRSYHKSCTPFAHILIDRILGLLGLSFKFVISGCQSRSTEVLFCSCHAVRGCLQCGALHFTCLAGPYFSLGCGFPTGALQDHPHTFVTSTPCLPCVLPSYTPGLLTRTCVRAPLSFRASRPMIPPCVCITVSSCRLHVQCGQQPFAPRSPSHQCMHEVAPIQIVASFASTCLCWHPQHACISVANLCQFLAYCPPQVT
jgi:hypothetical protein